MEFNEFQYSGTSKCYSWWKVGVYEAIWLKFWRGLIRSISARKPHNDMITLFHDDTRKGTEKIWRCSKVKIFKSSLGSMVSRVNWFFQNFLFIQLFWSSFQKTKLRFLHCHLAGISNTRILGLQFSA